GTGEIERLAIAVIGDAVGKPMRLGARQKLVEARRRDFQRDMPPAAAGRQDRACRLVSVGIGELEEGEGAAIGQAEEGVAVIDLAREIRVKGPLAPGRDQRQAENVLEEMAVDLLVLDDEGMVVQPQRQLGEAFGFEIALQLVGHALPPSRRAWTNPSMI